MTKEEKREIYESIMKKLSKYAKRIIEELTLEEMFVPNDELLHRFINIDSKKLHETYDRNISMFNKHINEANGEDLFPIINDIALGTSSFGHHNYRDREIINPYQPESVKDLILLHQNAFVDLYNMFNFDDWQFVMSENDGIYYLDLLIPADKQGLEQFLHKLDSFGYHYKIEQDAIRNYFKNFRPVTTEEQDIYNSWTYIRIFEKTDSNQRDKIRNISQYLCHYTLRSNKEQILKNGIIAKNFSHLNYPKRIFMIVDNRDDIASKIKDSDGVLEFDKQRDALLNRLVDYRQKEGHQATKDDFIEVVIDIDKLPSDVELHFDQNCYPYAVYTKSDIPSEAIVDFNKI